MHRYDPDEAPDLELWLSLDERERIRLAEEFHGTPRVAATTWPKVRNINSAV